MYTISVRLLQPSLLDSINVMMESTTAMLMSVQRPSLTPSRLDRYGGIDSSLG